MKKINYKHYICIIITIGFIACAVFLFSNSLGRVIESVRDFGLSVAYYFCELCNIPHNIPPTVNNPAAIPFFEFTSNSVGMPVTTIIPDTATGFADNWVLYWQTWATLDNLFAYMLFLGDILLNVMRVLVFVIPFIVLLYMEFKRYIRNENNDYDYESKPLRIAKKFAEKVYIPIKQWAKDFWIFIKNHKIYRVIWVLIWLWNFNIFTIGIEFLAYYFYFVVSFDFANIYMQVYKLFVDLSVPLTFIPVWVWVIVGLWLFGKFRKKVAISRLYGKEAHNSDFIGRRQICSLVWAPMGGYKSTFITDMSLTSAVKMRDKAYDKMIEHQLKFPHFPWQKFENDMRRVMKEGKIYNIATCKKYIEILMNESKERINIDSSESQHKKKYSKRHIYSDVLFGYDYKRYGVTYNDKLKIITLGDVLETYSKLYFLYVVPSSLIYSNYAIRSDNVCLEKGNLPLWDNSFFGRDCRDMACNSRYSHVIDFDMLRLGKKVIENNKNKDVFEFGTISITEVGKERGNKIENEGKRKIEDTANQKNDMFEKGLMMVRHRTTVDNFPFVKIFMDEQRPESLGANARELADLVHVVGSSDMLLTLPFFGLERTLYNLLFGRFVSLYTEYRHNRGDNTLRMYLFKSIMAKVHKYYTGIYNQYGYRVLNLELESGRMDGAKVEDVYYIMSAKAYASRFTTDCLSGFFAPRAAQSEVGIMDVPTFATISATMDELDNENSYFVMDMKNIE